MSDKCCNIKLIDTINQQLKRLNWCKQLLQFRLFHRSRTKLWEGNVFSRVFLSVHMGVTITHDILDLTVPDILGTKSHSMFDKRAVQRILLECFLV